jgi:hemerythrin-like domain-containing protein
MLLKIGQTADHGFDEPLALLSDCHRRIERFLGVMLKIAERRRGAALAEADRRALHEAMRYFATAAPRHTADEEASLFPRLRASRDPAAADALAAVEALEADHRRASSHHEAVDTLATRWIGAGALEVEDVRALKDHLHALQRLYQAHIRVEDTQLFPAALRMLSDRDLEAIGREMAERRGVPFTPSI